VPPTPPPTPVPSASPTPEICTRIDEGFDGFIDPDWTIPADWDFTGIGAGDVYTSLGNYGHLSPSLKFDAIGDSIVTPSFAYGDWLQFWIKGQNTAGSSNLLVEEYWDGSWNEITTILPLPLSGTVFTGLALNQSSSQVKFTFNKQTGNLALDDVLVSCRPSSGFRSVVFNEFAWFGTAANADHEWMELRSNSSSAINLQNWRIAADDGNPDFTILSDLEIPAYGFFLLKRGTEECIVDVPADYIYPVDNEMDDSGDWMQLFDPDGALVDEVIEGSWFAGTGEPYYFTMERIDPETTGNVYWNWYDNDGVDRTGTDAGDNEINGTPGEENSDYDPTYVELVDFYATGYDSLIAVEWETGAEIDNFGFLVHRADSRQGPYRRVSNFILAAGGPSGGRYLFPDRLVANGLVYYYHLEALDTSGKSDWYGPVSARPEAASDEFIYMPGGYAGIGTSADATPSPVPTASVTPVPLPTAHCPLPIVDWGDYDGDGTSDIAIFRPESGLWAVQGKTRFYFGAAGDIPAPGNYFGDGTAAAGIYRPASGLWAIRQFSRFYFGGGGDIPVPADYTGDGWTDPAIFRPATGLWAVRGSSRAYFGRQGDLPVPGDYDGDGTAEFALFRSDSGLWAVWGLARLYFGTSGDIPVPGNYFGDGIAAVGIYRPTSGLWAIRDFSRFYFGGAGDIPIPLDREGKWTHLPAIFRKSSGLWAIRSLTRLYFGAGSNLPVTR